MRPHFRKNFLRVSRRDKSDKLSPFSLFHFLSGNRESEWRRKERKWEWEKNWESERKKSRREKMRISTDERVSTHHFQDFIDFSFKRSVFVFSANQVVVFFLSISFLILVVKTSGSNNSLLKWSSSYTLKTLHFFRITNNGEGKEFSRKREREREGELGCMRWGKVLHREPCLHLLSADTNLWCSRVRKVLTENLIQVCYKKVIHKLFVFIHSTFTHLNIFFYLSFYFSFLQSIEEEQLKSY